MSRRDGCTSALIHEEVREHGVNCVENIVDPPHISTRKISKLQVELEPNPSGKRTNHLLFMKHCCKSLLRWQLAGCPFDINPLIVISGVE